MINKELRGSTNTDNLNKLLERRQSFYGASPSGRIGMVGTSLGRVAAGIFPNGILKTVEIVVATDEGELTTYMTFTSTEGCALEPTKLYTSHAFIGEREHGTDGLEEWPLPSEDRRVEMAMLGQILNRVANAGGAYDPFQSEQLESHLITAVDSAPSIHPAVLEAISPIRN